MAKNDTVLLDGIIEQRVREEVPSMRRDEVFEYLVFEQLLKDYDLSREEIDSGWVDGRDDGGIDGFFVLINGRLLTDPEGFSWPKRNVEIEVWVVTCKTHDTFEQAPLNSLVASMSELLDFSREKTELRGAYSDGVLRVRAMLHMACRELSAARPRLSFKFRYASRGDSTQVGENIRARAGQLVSAAESLFSFCSVEFEFVGAYELLSAYRKERSFSLSLPFAEYLPSGQGGYVVLAKLDEYHRFVTDAQGNLRRYLFDSNVRDYVGKTSVNEDIVATLADASAPNFWWLNNGITILATNAAVVGKTIQMHDIQIVNGLQTTESIYRHFSSGATDPGGRVLLIKVIVSSDPAVRDHIIVATNSQNAVEPTSLRATDKLQRDIEDILEKQAWYYERRKNYYRNIGKPLARFVTPMYLATGYVSVVMKNPAQAARLKMKFMQHEESYRQVFNDDVPIRVWPQIVAIMKRTDEGLELVRPGKPGASERFLHRWRNLVAFLAVSRLLKTFGYSIKDLLELNADLIGPPLVEDVQRGIARFSTGDPKEWKRLGFAAIACTKVATEFGLDGVEEVGRRSVYQWWGKGIGSISDELLERVNRALPPQPWPKGVHGAVATKLGLKKAVVHAAIQKLIGSGRRNVQRNGVVYGSDGSILARAGST